MAGRTLFRVGVPLAAAAGILFVAAWLGGQLLPALERHPDRPFDPNPTIWASTLGYLSTAAGAGAVAGLAWWARSALVEAAYVLVGGFFAFLVPITWLLAAEINGAPPVLPQPVALVVSNIYFWSAEGPLNAVSIVGAAMFLAGLALLAPRIRRGLAKRSDTRSAELTANAA